MFGTEVVGGIEKKKNKQKLQINKNIHLLGDRVLDSEIIYHRV